MKVAGALAVVAVVLIVTQALKPDAQLDNAFIYQVKAKANQCVIQQLISAAKKTESGNIYKNDYKEAVNYCKKQEQTASHLEILSAYND